MRMTTEHFKDVLGFYNWYMATSAWISSEVVSNCLKFMSGQFVEDNRCGNGEVAASIYSRVINPEPPDWTSNLNEGKIVISKSKNHRLWQFHKGVRGTVFVMPPFAGRRGEIVDRQCEMLKALDCNIFVFELLEADDDNKDLTWDGYFGILENCLQAIGEPVVLVGNCQGAWASFILTCLHSDKIRAYVNLAGPLDFSAGNGAIRKNCQKLGSDYFQNMVNWSGGRQYGWMQWLSFASMAPTYFFWERYAKLYNAFMEMRLNGNFGPVEKWIQEHNWMDDPIDLPGPYFAHLVSQLFVRGNALVKGEVLVRGEKVDPAKAECPFLMVAGGDDEITPACQLSIKEYLPNVKSFETRVLKGHGHTRVLLSKESINGNVLPFVDNVISA